MPKDHQPKWNIIRRNVKEMPWKTKRRVLRVGEGDTELLITAQRLNPNHIKI